MSRSKKTTQPQQPVKLGLEAVEALASRMREERFTVTHDASQLLVLDGTRIVALGVNLGDVPSLGLGSRLWLVMVECRVETGTASDLWSCQCSECSKLQRQASA